MEHINKDPSKTMNIKYTNQIISLESNGTCLATCPPGHLTTNDSECIRCHQGCTQCAGSPFACLACQPGFSLDSQRQVCVRDTPLSGGHCDADCYECDAKRQCVVCRRGLAASGGRCVEEVGEGFYRSYIFLDCI